MVTTGDKVEVQSGKKKYAGIVMPSAEKEFLSLKLDSGYNIGIKLAKDVKIKKIGEVKFEGLPSYKPPRKNLPYVSLIATGGTITSRVDYKTGAVFPLEKPEDLLLSVPELADIVNIKQIKQPFTLLSEDMSSDEWTALAKEVLKELNSDSVGVIVTHGTDTLHYTAAALSFMLKNLSKPVAIVGGQRSSDRGSFDGALNLICAAHYCKSDIAEVAVVMHGEEEGTFCLANRGTKCRKMHTSRRDTFRPINELPLAKIFKDGKIQILNKKYKPRFDHHAEIVLDAKFEPKVALVKFVPGMSPEILDYYVDKKYKGIIIEATGLGHVATQPIKKQNSWLPSIQNAIKKGVFIGFAPQCLYGRLNPSVYANARILQDAGVVFLEDILPEVAYIKLGWALGHTKDLKEIKEMMLTNIAGEINPRIEPKAFLY